MARIPFDSPKLVSIPGFLVLEPGVVREADAGAVEFQEPPREAVREPVA
jgi:hypothetical protein